MTAKPNYPDAVGRVDTAELRELLEKATPGPWAVVQNTAGPVMVWSFDEGPRQSPVCAIQINGDEQSNADLIVAAINTLPALLSQLDKLETEKEAWKGHYDGATARTAEYARQAIAAQASNASLVGALRAAQDWQPIETAPRDGTHIILAFGQDHSSEGWYLDDDDEPRPWAFIDIGDNNMVIINRSRDGEYGPSHWRPMPYREPRNRAEPRLATPESGEAAADNNPERSARLRPRAELLAMIDGMVAAGMQAANSDTLPMLGALSEAAERIRAEDNNRKGAETELEPNLCACGSPGPDGYCNCDPALSPSRSPVGAEVEQ